MDNCVFQEWVRELPMKMQSVLILGLRGPDTDRLIKVKTYTRWLRGLILKPADPDNPNFMLAQPPEEIIEKSEIARELEFVTQHYYAHLMHTLEIVGYRHPDKEIAGAAFHRYELMAKLFHLNVETREEFEIRLAPKNWRGSQPSSFQEADLQAREQGMLWTVQKEY